jgi:hypothetical protein
MPYWIEFDQMRSIKDVDNYEDFDSYKKGKDLSNRLSLDADKDDTGGSRSGKWNNTQYLKALKLQLVL